MASIGHAAIGMVAARLFRRAAPPRVSLAVSMALWSALSFLPDADVLAFTLGIPYAAPFGHRGATHSFAFALLVAALLAVAARRLQVNRARLFLFAALVVASHPLLDILTNGGLGCALFYPLDDARHFAPWRPIPVAPIGLRFFSVRGLQVAVTELVTFAPLFAFALWPRRPEWVSLE